MNEAKIRAELIDPLLKKRGWSKITDTKIFRKYPINQEKIQTGKKRAKLLIADYFVYKNNKLADLNEQKKSILKKSFEGKL